MTTIQPGRRGRAVLAATLASGVTMLLLNLTWLGVIAAGIYERALGPLKRPDVFVPAAILFYLIYLAAIVGHAVVGARNADDAWRRGAGLGLVAYATFDLTNWAVVRDWPAMLVPIDMVWGILLTSVVARVGYAAWVRAGA